MTPEQLVRRLEARAARARRGAWEAERVWWNGELLDVAEALRRALALPADEPIRARGDEVLLPRRLANV